MWLCQCACGNLTTVSSTHLMRPNGTRSCGCLKHQLSPSLIDLTGQTFGRLKVLRRDETAPGSRIKWICQCKCGNTVSVLSSSLRNGKTKSCGCSQSPVKYDLTGQEFGVSPCHRACDKSAHSKPRCPVEVLVSELRPHCPSR